MRLRNKKTGYICDFLGTYSATPYFGISVDYHNGEPKCYEYKSLAELNDEWEDCEPQEPLIKDEKIRKVVRAWADTLNVTKVYIKQIGSSVLCITLLGDEKYDDQFKIELPYSNHLGGFYYTIAELCGEEE